MGMMIGIIMLMHEVCQPTTYDNRHREPADPTQLDKYVVMYCRWKLGLLTLA